MTTVTIEGREYPLAFNFGSQLYLERLTAANPGATEGSPLYKSLILVLSCLLGASNGDTDITFDSLLAAINKERGLYARLMESVNAEAEAFRAFNEGLQDESKAVKKKRRKQ